MQNKTVSSLQESSLVHQSSVENYQDYQQIQLPYLDSQENL